MNDLHFGIKKQLYTFKILKGKFGFELSEDLCDLKG